MLLVLARQGLNFLRQRLADHHLQEHVADHHIAILLLLLRFQGMRAPPEMKVYLAAHVVLLSRVTGIMSVGLVMHGGQSEEVQDR